MRLSGSFLSRTYLAPCPSFSQPPSVYVQLDVSIDVLISASQGAFLLNMLTVHSGGQRAELTATSQEPGSRDRPDEGVGDSGLQAGGRGGASLELGWRVGWGDRNNYLGGTQAGQALAALMGRGRHPVVLRCRSTSESSYPIPELSGQMSVCICLGRLFFSSLFIHT